jgi:hypothetical protein
MVRPACPRHPVSRVVFDGTYGAPGRSAACKRAARGRCLGDEKPRTRPFSTVADSGTVTVTGAGAIASKPNTGAINNPGTGAITPCAEARTFTSCPADLDMRTVGRRQR